VKKPFKKMAVLATCAMLPLAVTAPLSAQAAPPPPSTSVTLKIDRNCVATVTGQWSRQPTAPTSVTVGVAEDTLLGGRVGDDVTTTKNLKTSGSYKYTFTNTINTTMEPTTDLHTVYALMLLNGSALTTGGSQEVYCTTDIQGQN
jgi:hypothetical protein